MLRVPWIDDHGNMQINRGFRVQVWEEGIRPLVVAQFLTADKSAQALGVPILN
jgi:hypothetical protein